MKKQKILPSLMMTGLLMTNLSSTNFNVSASSGYGGGSGTETDPYLISTPEHLNQLQLDVNVNGVGAAGKYYQLTNDIDLSGYDNDSDENNGNWTPIGRRPDLSHFGGTFDGNGYKISNLEINLPSEDYVGLFGITTGTIKKLGLENVVIDGNRYVGGLSGRQFGGTVSQCYVTGSVNGSSYTGGLVGAQYANGLITQSYSKVNVNNGVGGHLLGLQHSGEVSQSYSIGGLVGEQSMWEPDVIQQTISNSYWDKEISTLGNSVGGTGLTTAQMTGQAVKTNMAGFDFDTVWKTTDSYPKLKWEKEVVEVKYGGGSGTETDPYLISTPKHLNQLQLDVNVNGVDTSGEYYQLTNDIDLSGYDNDSDDSNGNFTPIGNNSYQFKGFFDGNGKVISNLKIILPSQDYVGLFGYTNSAIIQNVGLQGISIEGNDNTGGLIAYQIGGTVKRSYTKGVISVSSGGVYSGGLVGSQKDGVITQSYSTSTVNGNHMPAGLVGRVSGASTITQCYATGSITGLSGKGGLVGELNSNSSQVFESNYWDTQASGQSTSKVGTGLTTQQMIGENAKTNMVGFDFDVIWQTTDSYPELRPQEEPITSDEKEVLLNGMIKSTVLSLTIPTEMLDFVLDPNQEEGQQFIASDFELTNKSKAPLTIELKTFEQVTDALNDVEPTKYNDWTCLTQEQSKDFALALVPEVGDGWLNLNEGSRWVANLGEPNIGTVRGNSTISFSFEARHGLSFSEPLAPQYKLTFVFGLQD